MKKNIKPQSNLKKKRKQGFLKKSKTKEGLKVIQSRRKKGRKRLTA
jgi:large subunit ribosomal protein L34